MALLAGITRRSSRSCSRSTTLVLVPLIIILIVLSIQVQTAHNNGGHLSIASTADMQDILLHQALTSVHGEGFDSMHQHQQLQLRLDLEHDDTAHAAVPHAIEPEPPRHHHHHNARSQLMMLLHDELSPEPIEIDPLEPSPFVDSSIASDHGEHGPSGPSDLDPTATTTTMNAAPDTTSAQSSMTPTSTVLIFGIEFALLDGSDPMDSTRACQSEYLPLPDGWAIADGSLPLHRTAITAYPWGTSCLVLANGVALTPLLKTCSNKDALLRRGSRYKPSSCDQRILIFNKETSTDLRWMMLNPNFQTPPPDSFTSWQVMHGAPYTIQNSMLSIQVPRQSEENAALNPAIVKQSIAISAFEQRQQCIQQGFTFLIESQRRNVSSSSDADTSSHYVELQVHFVNQTLEPAIHRLEFHSQPNKWTMSHVSYVPQHTVDHIDIILYFGPKSGGTARFANIRFESLINLLHNPSLSSKKPSVVPYWHDFGAGYMPDIQNHGEAESRFANPPRATFVHSDDSDELHTSLWNSVLLASTPQHGATQGLYQEIEFASSTQARRIYVGGYSKATAVSGMPDANYAIYIDAVLSDKRTLYGQTISFSTGSHDWEYQDAVLAFPLPVVALNVSLLFRHHEGLVWFDDLIVRVAHAEEISKRAAAVVTPLDPTKTEQATNNATEAKESIAAHSASGCVGGILHNGVFSFVQASPATWFKRPIMYALDVPGEFVLFRSEFVQVQVRVKRRAKPLLGGVVTGVAMLLTTPSSRNHTADAAPQRVSVQLGGHHVYEDPFVYWNGRQYQVVHTPGSILLPGHGVFSWDSLSSPLPVSHGTPSLLYTLEFTGGAVMITTTFGKTERTMHVVVHLTQQAASNGAGLLGSCAEQQLVFASGAHVELETLSHTAESESIALSSLEPSMPIFDLPPAADFLSSHELSLISKWSINNLSPNTPHHHQHHHHHTNDAIVIDDDDDQDNTRAIHAHRQSFVSREIQVDDATDSPETQQQKHQPREEPQRVPRQVLARMPTSLDDIHAMQVSWLVTEDDTLFTYRSSESVASFQPLVVRQSVSFEELVAQGAPTARATMVCKQQYISTTQSWCLLQVMYSNDSMIVNDFHKVEAQLLAVQTRLAMVEGEQTRAQREHSKTPTKIATIIGCVVVAAIVALLLFLGIRYRERRWWSCRQAAILGTDAAGYREMHALNLDGDEELEDTLQRDDSTPPRDQVY